ncbi:MAG: aminoacetone oxidase family FAD-binding enzyme [Clostridiales bacterium]|nr:aminoacetone oxidase family FAD-binding enzyme [Clostridiales bacterium]
MENPYDMAIIGGGAAGLSAAVFACRAAAARGMTEGKLSVLVLEKGARVGRKLLATGNGTCNLANTEAAPERYHGRNAAFVAPALQRLPAGEVCRFFSSLGVECVTRENGRVYPRCLQAGAVLDCLRLEMQANGVEERCGTPVTALRQRGGGFELLTGGGDLCRARRVLVCTGGAASPSLGGSSDGYALLGGLGHSRSALFPTIVQVRTDPSLVKAVRGIRVDARVSFQLDGRELAAERGELLFTEYGLSGPVVMQISRCVGEWERKKQGRLTAVLDLLPDLDREETTALLIRRRRLKGRTLEQYLTGFVNKRLGQTLLRAAGLGPLSLPAEILTDGELAQLAARLKGWELAVTGTQGFAGAQATAGGVSTAEFDPYTLQSRLAPGLYAAGEVLDIDGDCGGFNLHWAWASACLAAEAMTAAQ